MFCFNINVCSCINNTDSSVKYVIPYGSRPLETYSTYTYTYTVISIKQFILNDQKFHVDQKKNSPNSIQKGICSLNVEVLRMNVFHAMFKLVSKPSTLFLTLTNRQLIYSIKLVIKNYSAPWRNCSNFQANGDRIQKAKALKSLGKRQAEVSQVFLIIT